MKEEKGVRGFWGLWWVVAGAVVILLVWTGYDWWEAEKAQEKKEQDLAEREVVKATPVPSPTSEATPVPTVTPTPIPEKAVVHTSEFSRILAENCRFDGSGYEGKIAIDVLPFNISPELLSRVSNTASCYNPEYNREINDKMWASAGGIVFVHQDSIGCIGCSPPMSYLIMASFPNTVPKCENNELTIDLTDPQNMEVAGEGSGLYNAVQKHECLSVNVSEGGTVALVYDDMSFLNQVNFDLYGYRLSADGTVMALARNHLSLDYDSYPELVSISNVYLQPSNNTPAGVEVREGMDGREMERKLLEEVVKLPVFAEMKAEMAATLNGISFKN